MVTGAPVGYVAGNGHLPIPLADGPYRRAHTPRTPKPTGLDWDALKPTCTGCSEKSSEVLDGLCPTCRGVKPTRATKAKPANSGRMTFDQLDDNEIERRYTAPTDAPPALADELDQLEHDDPDVAAAAASLDDMADRATRPDDHVVPDHLTVDVPADLPPTYPAQETTVTSPPFPTYIVDIAVVLRDSENHPDAAVRVARKAVANALVGLNRELTRYGDPAASTMPAPAPSGVRIPPPIGTRASKLRPHHAELIGAYLAGATTVELAGRYGVTDSAVGLYLRKHGIPTRNTRRTTTTGAAPA